MTSPLQDRLDSVPSLRGRYRPLNADEAKLSYATAWSSVDLSAEAVHDVSDLSTMDAQELFLSVGLPTGTEVVVTYASDPTSAVAAEWGIFIRHWDDFWYPSSDDIRVCNMNGAVLIQIDHEEELTIVRRWDVGASGLAILANDSARRLSALGTSTFLLGYEPAGSKYQSLLNCGLRYCTYALLIMRDFAWTDQARAAVSKVQPWVVMTLDSKEWPGTRSTKLAKLLVMRYGPETAAELGTLTRRLYQWEQPDLPEDLSLFRSTGEPWLASTAHNQVGWLNLTRPELKAVSNAMGSLPLNEAVVAPDKGQ